MTRYYIREEYKGTLSTIYFDVQRRTPKLKMRISTGIQIEAKVWNSANRSANTWNKFISTDPGRQLAEKLEQIQQATNELISGGAVQSNADRHLIDEAISTILNADIIRLEQEKKEHKQKVQEQEKKGILSFYDYFVTGIQTGRIRHGNNTVYARGTIANWLSFGKHLYGYCSKSMTFDRINKEFADQFCAYLDGQGMLPTTCNKYIECFRKLCNLSAEYGVNHNAASLKVWKERYVSKEEKRAEIYLTDDELTAIYDYPLEGVEDEARDLFLLGCLSCQRFSDYGILSKENFGTTPNGIPVIKVKQVKTGVYVEVPIIDERVNEICEKYNYNFPRISDRRINDYILSFMEKIAETCPTLKEKVVTTLTFPERSKEKHFAKLLADTKAGRKPQGEERRTFAQMKEYAEKHDGKPLYERNVKGQIVKFKYELVTTHTARRSGVTNLYKTGLLGTREMMSISGHQSERVFENYIKVGVSEQAERIAKKLMQATVNKKSKEAI